MNDHDLLITIAADLKSIKERTTKCLEDQEERLKLLEQTTYKSQIDVGIMRSEVTTIKKKLNESSVSQASIGAGGGIAGGLSVIISKLLGMW